MKYERQFHKKNLDIKHNGACTTTLYFILPKIHNLLSVFLVIENSTEIEIFGYDNAHHHFYTMLVKLIYK